MSGGAAAGKSAPLADAQAIGSGGASTRQTVGAVAGVSARRRLA
ncbi:hypothetical protein [Thiospirillum jenense]|nr:hypothetical protein [Thiospirillum jenense]